MQFATKLLFLNMEIICIKFKRNILASMHSWKSNLISLFFNWCGYKCVDFLSRIGHQMSDILDLKNISRKTVTIKNSTPVDKNLHYFQRYFQQHMQRAENFRLVFGATNRWRECCETFRKAHRSFSFIGNMFSLLKVLF